jgi:twitching motility protein PilT
MAVIDKYFDMMMEKGGSDLHLMEGQPPKIRVHGEVAPIATEILTHEYLGNMMKEICEEKRFNKYLQTGDIDFAYALGDRARFRANFYMQDDGFGCIFRIIPSKILSLADLKSPEVLKKFAMFRSGIVLVTGPTGSGKSTTLAAIIDYINTNFSKHILTIEEPIEFVHPIKKSVIIQREVGIDAHSFNDALKTSTRQDLDIVLVGEMRDPETIALALKAAEMGSLVFGTLHTNSAVKTIDRIVDSFPSEEQENVLMVLGNALRGICSQLLLKTADGKGRCAVQEIMVEAQGLANMIRERKLSLLESLIQQGKKEGMQLMDDALWEKVQNKTIKGEDAYMKAKDKKRFGQWAPKSA